MDATASPPRRTASAPRAAALVRVLLALAAALLALAAVGAARAQAAVTRVVAPGAARMTDPCTSDTPCDLVYAIGASAGGDDVALQGGEYDYTGHATIGVPGGVRVHGLATGPSRPLVKATAVMDPGSPLLFPSSGATIQDLALDNQTNTSGPLGLPVDSIAERVVLTGKIGMYFVGGNGPQGGLRDSVVVSSAGPAVQALDVSARVENVTAIATGGDGLWARGDAGTTTITAVNTIARGDGYDLDVTSTGAATSSTLTASFSDFRHRADA